MNFGPVLKEVTCDCNEHTVCPQRGFASQVRCKIWVRLSPANPERNFFLETGKLDPEYTIPMLLHCPLCDERHIDEQEFEQDAHHTHACQHCGHVWRPAKVNTHGVRFLPGYKNTEPD